MLVDKLNARDWSEDEWTTRWNSKLTYGFKNSVKFKVNSELGHIFSAAKDFFDKEKKIDFSKFRLPYEEMWVELDPHILGVPNITYSSNEYGYNVASIEKERVYA